MRPDFPTARTASVLARGLIAIAMTLALVLPGHAQAPTAPTVTVTNRVVNSSGNATACVLPPGGRMRLFSFTVTNNDTGQFIYLDQVRVGLNGVTGGALTGLFSVGVDLDTIQVINQSTGLRSIVDVTGDPAIVDMHFTETGSTRGDTQIGPTATSATFDVFVIASPDTTLNRNTSGGRFTANMTKNATTNEGLVVRALAGDTDITPDHTVTTPEITIPHVTVTAGDIYPERFIVGPNSDVQLAMGIRIGALATNQNEDELDAILVRFHNVDDFIPGGTIADDYGDLEFFEIFKDNGDGSFGPTGNTDPSTGNGLNDNGDIIFARYRRSDITAAIGGVTSEQVVYQGTFSDAGLGLGSAATRNEIPNLTSLPVTGSSSFKGASFWIGFETNQRFSSEILQNGVGAGDAWYLEMVALQATFRVNEGNDSTVIFVFDSSVQAAAICDTITSVLVDIDSGRIIVPVHLSDRAADFSVSGSTIGSDDNQGLDFLEFTPIFGLHTLGGPATPAVAVVPQLQRIQLRILDPNNTIDLTGANSPLRPINGTRLSGIQLRKNRNGVGAVSALETTDDLVAIDPSQTTYTNNPGYDTLTLAFLPNTLPQVSVKAGMTGDQTASGAPVTNNWDPSDAAFIIDDPPSGALLPNNNEYFIGVLASSRARTGDTLVFEIPSRGIIYNNGVRSNDYLTARSKIMFSPPVTPGDMVTSGDILGESSAATPMIRFRVNGNNRGETLARVYCYFIDTNSTGLVQLSQSDFLDHDFNGVPFTNAFDGSGNSLAGVAVYRDANNNGLFDLASDVRLTFDTATLGTADGSNFINPGIDVDNLGGVTGGVLLARMILDTSDSHARILNGDSNVFFICVRSSGTIDANDKFLAVIGDLDAVRSNGTYIDAEAAGLWFTTDFDTMHTWTNQAIVSDGRDTYGAIDDQLVRDSQQGLFPNGLPGWRREDHFRSTAIRGEAIDDVLLTDLTTFNQTFFSGDRVAVFGLNVIGTADLTVTLDSIAVRVADGGSGGFNRNTDLAALANSAASGIAIFIDSGSIDGVFDSSDPVASWNVPSYDANGKAVFTFTTPIAVPPNDAGIFAGDDVFVVLNFSSSITFRDDMVAVVPDNPLGFSVRTSKQPNSDTTNTLTAGLPVTLAQTSETQVNSDGTRTAVLSISAADSIASGADGGVTLTSVAVEFVDVLGFSITTDLQALATDNSSGVALYRDDGSTTGSFDSSDNFIALNSITRSGNVVTMTLATGDTVPGGTTGADSGADWFVVLRGSTGANVVAPVDQFQIVFDAIQWSTPFAPTDTTTTVSTISFTGIPPTGNVSANPTSASNKIVISPNGDGVRDTASIRVQLPIQADSTVALALYSRLGSNVTANRLGDTLGQKGSGANFHIDSGAAAGLFNFEELEYSIVVAYEERGESTPVTITDSLVVDRSAFAPTTLTVTPTSSGATTATVAISGGMNFDPTTASGTDTQKSNFRAKIAAENTLGLNLTVNVVGPSAADSSTVSETLAATTSGNFSYTFTSPVTTFTGLNTVTVIMRDIAGNTATASTTYFLSSTTAGGAISFEGSQPVFKYNPVTNPSFTFTFQEPAVSGGIEVFNAAGARLGTLNVTPGQATLVWEPKNSDGTLLRNGVYLMRFKVGLQSGSGINETRSLFLLK